MAYYSAFQSNVFQSNAYQIKTVAPDNDVVLLGGGPGREKEPVYNPHVFQYRQEELRRQSLSKKYAEIKRIDNELADAEKKRLEALEKARAKRLAKKAAKELAALEALLQEEIDRLRIERIWLMRRIDDEECILILLIRKRKRLI